jgi:hypothetical protein
MARNQTNLPAVAAILFLASGCSSHNAGPLLTAPPSAAADDYVYVADVDRIRHYVPMAKSNGPIRSVTI